MDVLFLVLSGMRMLCTFVLAFVSYQLFKALYLSVNDWYEDQPKKLGLLFRLAPRAASVVLVVAVLALVL